MDSFKKVIIPILLVIVFITVAGVYYRKSQGLSPLPLNSTQTPAVQESKTATIGNAVIKVDMASSDAERQRGYREGQV